MGKVLSVCVPSYNMEKYLNRCIDSFLVPEILDRLELIIVNDGSTDKTLSIANDYKAKYPQTIVVIDKPNGHYGSCVNASLKVATGKYFRIVDADDWVDSGALVTFIDTLENIDVDCVCTNFTIHNENKHLVRVISHNSPCNLELDLNLYKVTEDFVYMHSLTYLTKLLIGIHYSQTEGICYTDTEYSYTPLASAKSIYFLDISLYQYFIGRSNQSMASEALLKNFKHILAEITQIKIKHEFPYPFNRNEIVIFAILMERLINMAVPIYLLKFNYNTLIDKELKEAIAELYRNGGTYRGLRDNTLYKVPYIYLWYHSGAFSKYVMYLIRLIKSIHLNLCP